MITIPQSIPAINAEAISRALRRKAIVDDVFDFSDSQDKYDWLIGKQNKILGVPGLYVTPEVLQAGTVITGNNTAGWAVYSTWGTLAYDTVNFRSTKNMAELRALKISGGSSTNQLFYYDLGAETDLTNKILLLQFYLHEGSGISSPSNYTYIYIYTSQLNSGSPQYSVAAMRSPTVHPGALGVTSDDTLAGWYREELPFSSFTSYLGGVLTNVRYIWIWLIKAADSTPSFTIDKINIIDSPHANGLYAIRIDCPDTNATTDAMRVCSYAAGKGVRLCIGVSPWYVGQGTYFTVDNLREIHKQGHELCTYMGNCGVLGIPNNWQDKTQAEKVRQFRYARDWFNQYGFGQQAAEICFCSGGRPFTYHDSNYYKTKYATISSELKYAPKVLYDPSKLDTSLFIDNATLPSEATIDSKIATAETDKTCLIIGSHINDSPEYGRLAYAIDALAASSLVGKTFSELYSGK